MIDRRLAAAAALLLAAVYWKLFLPPFREEVLPALRSAAAMEQLYLPAALWRTSD